MAGRANVIFDSIARTAFSSSPATLPVASKLLRITGFDGEAPTWNCTVQISVWELDGPSQDTLTAHITGAPNGAWIDVRNLFPQVSTTASAPTQAGDVEIMITPKETCQCSAEYVVGK